MSPSAPTLFNLTLFVRLAIFYLISPGSVVPSGGFTGILVWCT